MNDSWSRRQVIQAAGLSTVFPAPAAAAVAEGPKICLGVPPNTDDAGMRRLRQIGVDHVLMGGPKIPWKEADIRALIERFKAGGITICNLMISGFNDVIWGRAGAEAQTQAVVDSILAAGRAGLAVIEYNFYANRLTEGYKEETGRAGAGYTAYDYELSKSLPPREDVGTHTRAAQLERARRFLKAVVPAAEKAGVRLAIHPNDPPVPLSRGSEQIIATFDHWKEYLNLVDSPYHGMTYDCGVCREMGEDPVAVCRYLGERDRINHAHYRNVRVRKSYVDYVEVFLDDGEVDMFAVMRELVRQKYPRAIYPEHPRGLDLDRILGKPNFYPGGGGFAGEIYNVGYTRAMLQAAQSLA